MAFLKNKAFPSLLLDHLSPSTVYETFRGCLSLTLLSTQKRSLTYAASDLFILKQGPVLLPLRHPALAREPLQIHKGLHLY